MEEIYIGKLDNKKIYIIFTNLLGIDYLTIYSKKYLLLFVDINLKTKSINNLIISKKYLKCYLDIA